MSATVRVYVNGKGVDAPSNATALDAVRLLDPHIAEALVAGERALTDSRGLPAANDTPVYGGAIFRVVSNRRRSSGGEES